MVDKQSRHEEDARESVPSDPTSMLTPIPDHLNGMTARPVQTHKLTRQPQMRRAHHRGRATFDGALHALVQFLPSGTCFVLPLARAVILGRADGGDSVDMLDLSALRGYRHGVSRQHAMLRRAENHLTVTDLGSRNGTFLNGERLLPRQVSVLADGDELALGTLHMVVFFVAAADG